MILGLKGIKDIIALNHFLSIMRLCLFIMCDYDYAYIVPSEISHLA